MISSPVNQSLNAENLHASEGQASKSTRIQIITPFYAYDCYKGGKNTRQVKYAGKIHKLRGKTRIYRELLHIYHIVKRMLRRFRVAI